MNFPLLSVRIEFEDDVVAARLRTRQVAEALGFDGQQQTRLATAVSEIARNAFCYGSGGKAEFYLEGTAQPQLLCVRVSDEGPGIHNLEDILEGRYRSETGMGFGIVGARRLMDQFRVTTKPGQGTVVTMSTLLPKKAPPVTPHTLVGLRATLDEQKPRDLLADFREQNRELLRTLDELRRRQEELISVNRELEDTNRGVVALYAELDEKADYLKRADDVKSKFLSNMSHEFRTPLNSILALSRILLNRLDGDLTSEQELQLTYIRKSAEGLSEMVNDLLDIAKVESGKTEIRYEEFSVASLFGALRGMLRPLLLSSSLNLAFEDSTDIPPILSDEGKVSQILRNFISNALKFTEAGEVRVSAKYEPVTDTAVFFVRDTGIGIREEHYESIFQEFTQVDGPLQRAFKGTGLGLPISRKLAELLGGSVGVKSEPGKGSEFYLRIPRTKADPDFVSQPSEAGVSKRPAVLVVQDHPEARTVYEGYLRLSPWRLLAARTMREAEAVLRHTRPCAVILDTDLEGEHTWHQVAHMKSNALMREIPLIVASALADPSKAMGVGADFHLSKPITGPALRSALREVTRRVVRNVLLVDDEDVSRYLVRQMFDETSANFLEAEDGAKALAMARAEKPDLMLIDLVMPRMTGFELLSGIEAEPALRATPVIVVTSKLLTSDERDWLGSRTLAVIAKDRLMEDEAARTLASVLPAVGLRDLIDGSRAPSKSETSL